MDAPADKALHQFLHSPQRGYPGAVNGLLSMDDVRAGIKGAGAAFADECDFAPFPCSADGKLASRIAGAGVNGALHAVSVCHLHNAVHGFVRFEHIIHQSQFLCQADTVIIHFHADEHVGSHGLCKHKRSQTHRAQAGYQHRIVAADADFFNGFIYRAEAAGYLCAVLVGQFVRQRDQILFIRQDVRRHAAVPLPAVSLTETALAGYVIASAAVVAYTAAGNMVNNNSVSFFKAF